jgi:hypothetical protein
VGVQVRELVSAFGELKAFNLVRDASTNISKVRLPSEFTISGQ